MVSLARASLRYEAKRFLPAALAVAFSGLLMLVQLGLLLGMFGTVSTVIDYAKADLWVGFAATPSFDLGRPIAVRHETALRMHPEVVAVERLIVGYADWRNPNGQPTGGMLVGIDPGEESLGAPVSFTPEQRAALAEPGAVIVDEADAGKLGARVGEVVEINGRRARVVGLSTGFRSIGGATIFCSLYTAYLLLGPQSADADSATYLLAKLRDPATAENVRDALQPRGEHPPYKVWTAPEFSVGSQLYWLLESGAGASFAFSSTLGLLVGIVITSQTLMAALIASLREYATLRALGVSRRRLSAVVLEQAFWIGVLGLGIAGLASVAVWMAANAYGVGMTFTWWAVLGTGAVTLGVALGAGLLALRALARVEPAVLLR